MKLRNLAYVGVVIGVFAAALSGALNEPVHADWLRFRGPNGTGIAETDAPVEFGTNQNLKWKQELPGRGVSSPIVVGDKVFVTCYSGCGMGKNDEQIEELQRHLVCLDRASGNTIWARTVDAIQPEDPYRPPGVTTHGYASNTPVSDGESVFAFFGKSGAHAFDLDGNRLWSRSVGNEPGSKGFGSAASPILTEQHVVINASDESLSLFWLDKSTGAVFHQAEAAALADCWTTPVLVGEGDSATVVLSVIEEVWGMNAKTGKLRWYANGVNSRNAQVSAVATDDGTVYAIGEEAYALKPEGKGNISDSSTVWEGRVRTRYATPVVHRGHLFSISGTVVECVDITDGSRVFQERLPNLKSQSTSDQQPAGNVTAGRRFGGNQFGGGFRDRSRGGDGGGRGADDYASPVIAGDRIYITMNSGIIHVIEANSKFKHLSANDLSSDTSGFGATPAISGGQIFLRSNRYVYCFGE